MEEHPSVFLMVTNDMDEMLSISSGDHCYNSDAAINYSDRLDPISKALFGFLCHLIKLGAKDCLSPCVC